MRYRFLVFVTAFVAAQIAVALAGFAGVVVVFRRESVHDWSAIGAGALLLQFFNIAILDAFWPFFTGIVVHLLAAMFQFARIILRPPET